MERRVDVYFFATLGFIAWVWEVVRKKPESSNAEQEANTQLWAMEVEKARRDLIEYGAISGPPSRWTENDKKLYWNYAEKSYLKHLTELSNEFTREDRRATLRKYWEWADDRSIDGYPSLDGIEKEATKVSKRQVSVSTRLK
jgi:type I restriction-modification system DNA methylase subunit